MFNLDIDYHKLQIRYIKIHVYSVTILFTSEAQIRQPCGVSVSDTWTREQAWDTCRIRVRYATWRIVDQIVGQRLWIQLGHGGDTTDRFHGFFFFFGLKKNPNFSFFSSSSKSKNHAAFALLPQRAKIKLLPQKHKNHTQETGLANWEVRVNDDAIDRQANNADNAEEKVC